MAYLEYVDNGKHVYADNDTMSYDHICSWCGDYFETLAPTDDMYCGDCFLLAVDIIKTWWIQRRISRK